MGIINVFVSLVVIIVIRGLIVCYGYKCWNGMETMLFVVKYKNKPRWASVSCIKHVRVAQQTQVMWHVCDPLICGTLQGI